METTIIYEVPGLKVSAKMRKGIEKLERKFGKLNKRFFVERNKEVRLSFPIGVLYQVGKDRAI